MDCSMPGFLVLHCLPEFAQTQVLWIGDAIQPSHLLSSLSLFPLIFPSIRVFSNESGLHISGQSIGASASASVLLKNIQSWFLLGLTGLISLLSKGLFKHLLQLHSLKASVLGPRRRLSIKLSHPCITTRKTIALTIWTFVGKEISLVFNTLSRFVITFLPRSKHLLISWLLSLSQWLWSLRK